MGSHSEIEVGYRRRLTPEAILNRGLKLLEFMENRVGSRLYRRNKNELLHIDFVNEERDEVPEIPQSLQQMVSPGKQIIALHFKGRVNSPPQQQRLNFGGVLLIIVKSIDRGKGYSLSKTRSCKLV